MGGLPNYTGGKVLAKLRAWVQLVLPTIYDDSLSFYELLAKVQKHLNDLTEAQVELDEKVKTLWEFVNGLDSGFTNLDEISYPEEV